MPTASNRNTMNMVFSRPGKSETQPKNGLVSPLRTRSIVNANVSAGRVMPINVIGVVSRWKSLAMGLSRRHQSARCHQHKHHIHDPERRLFEHLQRLVLNTSLLHESACRGFRCLARLWCEHQQRQQDHNNALANTEGEKCILVAVG